MKLESLATKMWKLKSNVLVCVRVLILNKISQESLDRFDWNIKPDSWLPPQIDISKHKTGFNSVLQM